jgi:hypothetical protein
MSLTSRQLNALPTLEWLIAGDEDNRRSGRSLTIAVAAIRQACADPGREVHVFDHWGDGHRGMNYIVSIVQRLALNDQRIADFLTVYRNSFRIDIHEPIYDWLPTEESLGTNPGPIQFPPELPISPLPPTAWERLSQDD